MIRNGLLPPSLRDESRIISKVASQRSLWQDDSDVMEAISTNRDRSTNERCSKWHTTSRATTLDRFLGANVHSEIFEQISSEKERGAITLERKVH